MLAPGQVAGSQPWKGHQMGPRSQATQLPACKGQSLDTNPPGCCICRGGSCWMNQLSTSGAHCLPMPHLHCPRQLSSLICFISPEQQLLPWLLFDDVEFVVMSERS